MRVIRPAALGSTGRRRGLLLALSMLAVGVIGAQLTLVGLDAPAAATGVVASTAAVAIGVGAAWLLRVVRPRWSHDAAHGLESLLTGVFDDSYTLIVSPPLRVRDAARLDGILVGPAGVRVLSVRDWEGRYRVRGRAWEFNAGRRRGWIRCRTNPSFDVTALAEGVGRWAVTEDLEHVPVRGAAVFPWAHSRILLEEPEDEIVTAENAPWWANMIGRARRLDEPGAARFVSAVLDAADTPAAQAEAPAVTPRAEP
ncbi:MAG: hypothetical protein ACRDGD_01935 [Candidatus Limnocylindria bacterium]